MNFHELARDRYSVRKFSSQPVEPETLNLLLRMVQLSPTAMNYQSQRLFVIQSEEAMQKLKRATQHTYGASLAFLMCYDRRRCWYHPLTNQPSGALDAAISLTHIMMEATDLGLGSLWVNGYLPEVLRKEFDLPSEFEDVAILFVGYPREDARPSHHHAETLPLTELAIIL